MLAGELRRVEATRLYYAESMSPSDIAHTLGVGKTVVCGWVERLRDANGGPVGVSRVVSRCVNYVLQVEPVLVRRSEGYACLLCGRTRLEKGSVHVLRRHRDVLDRYTESVVSRCLKKR
jgi:transposase-like protein